jgi:hypothetical protein
VEEQGGHWFLADMGSEIAAADAIYRIGFYTTGANGRAALKRWACSSLMRFHTRYVFELRPAHPSEAMASV